jgi:hypothetical protein
MGNFTPPDLTAFYIITGLLIVQAAICIVGALVRLKYYSSIGLSNRKVDWGISYKAKVALQCLMLVTLCCHAVPAFMDNQPNFFRVCAIIQQIVVWLVSLMMWRFEYKRALGHTWYLHPLLFTYCTLLYAAQIGI